jgi:hypothetical protein
MVGRGSLARRALRCPVRESGLTPSLDLTASTADESDGDAARSRGCPTCRWVAGRHRSTDPRGMCRAAPRRTSRIRSSRSLNACCTSGKSSDRRVGGEVFERGGRGKPFSPSLQRRALSVKWRTKTTTSTKSTARDGSTGPEPRPTALPARVRRRKGGGVTLDPVCVRITQKTLAILAHVWGGGQWACATEYTARIVNPNDSGHLGET